MGSGSLGPEVQLGAAWRLPRAPGPQGAPLVAPGLRLQLGQPLGPSFTASVPMFRADGRWRALPSVAAGASVRLP
ncbi:MAG: hypothetical protein R3F59_12775 [Myxococcota bacterium]